MLWAASGLRGRKVLREAPARNQKGENPMSTYIVLSKYTAQGGAAIKESPTRTEAARQMGKKMGVEMKAWYLAMGRYDVVTLWEAPDDETLIKVVMSIGSLGNVTTETMRLFTEEEFRTLVSGLP
jgi:uncharacterized protein with GYD domain